VTDAVMRVKNQSHIWALGDCAAIPDPQGNVYPTLAQHALREARVMARNVAASITQEKPRLEPFVYKNKGTLAALGHYSGVGKVYSFKIRGFLAWWVWRSYYMLQMPRWDRRLRIVLDWTLALFFKQDVVKLDTWHEPRPQEKNPSETVAVGSDGRPAKSGGGRSVDDKTHDGMTSTGSGAATRGSP